MATDPVRAGKAMALLVICFVLVCKTVQAGPQHVCPYPQACSNPGPPDTTHTVTATVRYDPDKHQCVSIPKVTGPHDCQQFASLKECKDSCLSARA